MAITLSQQSNLIATASSGTTSTLTFGSAFTAGQLVVVSILSYPGTEIVSIVDNQGNTYTRAVSAVASGANRAGIWYKANCASLGTTPVITITLAGTGNYITAKASSWNGVSTTPLIATGSAASYGTSHSVTSSGGSPAVGDLVITDIIADDGLANNAFVTPSGYTNLFQQQDSINTSGGQAAYKLATATGNQSATHTATGSITRIATIAVFSAASGGTEHIISVSGGIALSGTSTETRVRTPSISGGVSFSGGATETRNRVLSITGVLSLLGSAAISFVSGGASHTITVSGGVVFSGTGPFSRTRTQNTSGNLSLSGNTPLNKTRNISTSGQLALSGQATQQYTKIFIPSGSLNLFGSAPISFSGAGYTPTTKLQLTFAGVT